MPTLTARQTYVWIVTKKNQLRLDANGWFEARSAMTCAFWVFRATLVWFERDPGFAIHRAL